MKILLVEDEATLREQLAQGLRAAGYTVEPCDNGRDAHFLGDTEEFDAVVLDLGLPVMDGLTVLKHWRAAGSTMPVLILTARDSWHEKVAGIDAGADDYLTKPFHMEELLARVRALIRRAQGIASPLLSHRGVELDTRSRRVSVYNQAVTLTSHEYKILAYLMHRPDHSEHIYTQDSDRDSNTIEVFIGRLRKKLPPNMIETVRGMGYRLPKG